MVSSSKMDKLALFLQYLLLPGVVFSVTSQGGGHKSYIHFGGLGNVDIHVGKLLR